MFLSELIKEGKQTVSGFYPEREAGEMVFLFLEHLLGIKRYTHILEPQYQVSPQDVSASRSAFSRLAAGEPLQYVTGRAFFYGREFKVSPSVLIPRPETEILCREAAGHLRDSVHGALRVLDLCTGSGCIAWTLALECPGTEVVAADISEAALSVASSQDFASEMKASGASAPQFVLADVLAGPTDRFGSFDVLVGNPPYVLDREKALIRDNVLLHEPHLALFVPDDEPLLFYRAIACWAGSLLRPGGFGIVEINEALGRETADVFAKSGLTNVSVGKDLSGRDRFVAFFRGL